MEAIIIIIVLIMLATLFSKEEEGIDATEIKSCTKPQEKKASIAKPLNLFMDDLKTRETARKTQESIDARTKVIMAQEQERINEKILLDGYIAQKEAIEQRRADLRYAGFSDAEIETKMARSLPIDYYHADSGSNLKGYIMATEPTELTLAEQLAQAQADNATLVAQLSSSTNCSVRPKGFVKVSKALIVDVPLEVAITATDVVKDVSEIVTETTATIKNGAKILRGNSDAWYQKSLTELAIEAETRKELKDAYATAYKAQYKAQLEEMINDMKHH